MFDNIGRKIQGLAKFCCWSGIAVFTIIGIALIAIGDEAATIIGIVIIAVGSLVSWIGSFFVYGFGRLIETNEIIAANSPNRVPTSVEFTSKAPYNNPAAYAKMPGVAVQQKRCENCGNMISTDICPLCGNVHGETAKKMASLQKLVKDGVISAEDYNQKMGGILK